MERARCDARLARRVWQVHGEFDGTYGIPRVTAERKDAGFDVNHKRVARVMRRTGLQCVHLRKKVRTTVPGPSATPVPGLLQRDLAVSEPNTTYVGDGRSLCLATVLDLHAERLASWSIADHMRSDLVTGALQAAARTRGSLRKAVFRSDNGARYASKEFARVP